MRKITGARLTRFGLVRKLSVTRYPRMVLEAEADGRRPRGRRRKTWTDDIREALTERSYTWSRVIQLARDRAARDKFCQPSSSNDR